MMEDMLTRMLSDLPTTAILVYFLNRTYNSIDKYFERSVQALESIDTKLDTWLALIQGQWRRRAADIRSRELVAAAQGKKTLDELLDDEAQEYGRT